MKLKLLSVALVTFFSMSAHADLNGLFDAIQEDVEAEVQSQVDTQVDTHLKSQVTEQVAAQAGCTTDTGLAGGWTEVPITPELQEALETVLTQLDTTGTVSSLLSVKTQVVAGVNYLVDFELDNGETWHTKIFQDLAGNYSISEPAALGLSCP